jgi:hypothetical protein
LASTTLHCFSGVNLKGRLLSLVLGTVGKSVLRKAFVHSVKAIEARAVTPTTSR